MTRHDTALLHLTFYILSVEQSRSSILSLLEAATHSPQSVQRQLPWLQWFHIMLPRSRCVQNEDTIQRPFNSSSGHSTESVVHTLPPWFGLVSHKRMSTVTKQEYCFLPNCKWCEVRKTGCSNTPTTYLITS